MLQLVHQIATILYVYELAARSNYLNKKLTYTPEYYAKVRHLGCNPVGGNIYQELSRLSIEYSDNVVEDASWI